MSWRKVEVNGQSYRWKAGSFIVIQDADGRRISPPTLTCAAFKGMTQTEWESLETSSPHRAVTPFEIREFIAGLKADAV